MSDSDPFVYEPPGSSLTYAHLVPIDAGMEDQGGEGLASRPWEGSPMTSSLEDADALAPWPKAQIVLAAPSAQRRAAAAYIEAIEAKLPPGVAAAFGSGAGMFDVEAATAVDLDDLIDE